MEAQLRARLAELRRELGVGEHRLAQLDTERAHLRETRYCISAAPSRCSSNCSLRQPKIARIPRRVGEPVYRSGTIVGKALAAHEAGRGVIDIFVSPS